MNRIDPKVLKIAQGTGNESEILKITQGIGDDFSFWDYLYNRWDGPEVALAYSTAFWPELVEVEGFVLLKEQYEAEYLARVKANYGREKVEATINTTYLQDLFTDNTEGTDESVWTALGELLRDTWKARAEAVFPDREFATTFAWYTEDSDPGVTLFQTRLP